MASFPSLNMAFYDESAILAMVSIVDKPMRVDTTTIQVDRSKFGHVCVDIDLTKP